MTTMNPMPRPERRLDKPPFVNESNRSHIDEILSARDGRRRAFTLDYRSLEVATEDFEEAMKKRGVPQRLWKGALLYVDPHCVPNSYRGNPRGTVAWLYRSASSWVLVAVEEARVPHRSYGSKSVDIAVEFPQDNAAAIANAMLPKGMSIAGS